MFLQWEAMFWFDLCLIFENTLSEYISSLEFMKTPVNDEQFLSRFVQMPPNKEGSVLGDPHPFTPNAKSN